MNNSTIKTLMECINAMVEEAIDINRIIGRSISNIENLALMEYKSGVQKIYVLYNANELLKQIPYAKNYKQLSDLLENNIDKVIVAAGLTIPTNVIISKQQMTVRELKFIGSNLGRGPLMLAIIMKDAGAIVPDRETVYSGMKNLINTYYESVKDNTEAWKPLDKRSFSSIFKNTKQVHLHGNKALDNVYYATGVLASAPIENLRKTHIQILSNVEELYKGPEQPKSSAIKMALQVAANHYLSQKLK
jgi:hypothetical protein